jgi:hypothetical protein
MLQYNIILLQVLNHIILHVCVPNPWLFLSRCKAKMELIIASYTIILRPIYAKASM